MKQLKYFLIVISSLFAMNAHAQNTNNSKTLKSVYKNVFLIGVAVNPAIISGKDKAAQEIVINQFNSITPENVMKRRSSIRNPAFIISVRRMIMLPLEKNTTCSSWDIRWYGTINVRRGFLPTQTESPIQKKNRLKD